jgi:hypothetical protein
MNTMQLSNANTLLAEEMTSPATVLGHFAFPAEVGVRARDAADRIRMREKEQFAAIIKNGRDLLTMQKELGVDLFRAWIQVQCGISEHLAQKYMDLVISFGDDINRVPDLPLEVLYKLTAPRTPVSVWVTVFRYLKRGQRLTLGEIDHLILERQQAEKQVKKAEKRAKKAEQAVKKAERDAQVTTQQRARRDLM